MTDDPAIRFDDIVDAARAIAPAAVRTPLIENMRLNEQCGRRVLVKFEGAQHTGSFKFRGAYNRLARLDPAERVAGVVAWSSGNHAQGVAAAARMLDMPATIVMPADAPAIKIANTRALGAEVVPYDRFTQSREEIATGLARRRGAVLVPSFDDPFVIAGQGTTGLEIVAQAREAGADIGQLLVCCGGGGLSAGVATAVKALAPEVDIHTVEPAAFDDTARSLNSGVREGVSRDARSICDALMAPSPGALTFPILRALASDGLSVTDDQVRDAMRFAFSTLKLVVEPGGAVALAALLAGIAPPSDRPVAVVLSGSNVDPVDFAAILGGD
ncbi:threonine dehydratase [Sphingobium sp. OAS761]|uniref:threonine ammonia-lyase n=1 Tax=Sphingobium sp. OAS761 TaxID=2817901 RepID=UPI0020A1B51B|nr:threonine/serine dehydratase [Sphingobium sp. OAS761]MCP1468646.1 threonine dehydratase [Sphingobium sp. OAS761]